MGIRIRSAAAALCSGESTGQAHATSLGDLADMSPESRAWLAGFMSGNEPDAYEVFGLDDADPTDEQYEVWRHELAEFRESGTIRLPIRGDDTADAPERAEPRWNRAARSNHCRSQVAQRPPSDEVQATTSIWHSLMPSGYPRVTSA